MDVAALPRWPGQFARLAGAVVVCLGLAVLSGWALGVVVLKSVLREWPAMAPSAAVDFVLAGVALLLLVSEPTTSAIGNAANSLRSAARRIGYGCAIAMAAIGLLKLAEYLGGSPLHIDQIVFRESATAPDVAGPARMSFATALNFVLLGGALLLAHRLRGATLFQLLVLAAVLIGWLGFSHYFYGGEPLFSFAHMAVHTSLGFLLMGAGVLCIRPDVGLMALLVSKGVGGDIARRLLPAVVLLPLVAGWMSLQAQNAGWFGTEAGVSLFAISNIIIFTALVWGSGEYLNRLERARVHAESTTRGSQRLLQAVIDSAGAIIWVKDLDGRYLLANSSYEKLVGMRRESIVGKSDHDLFPKQQADLYRALDREAIVASAAVQAEELAFDDGRPVTYLSVKAPLFDEAGEPYAICGLSTDITQRKLADQTLVAERNLLRTLVDALPDVVFTKDTAGRFTMCNIAELNNVGLDREEQLIGKTVFDLYPRELAEAYHADDMAALSGNSVFNREEQSVSAGGQRRWYLTAKLPLRNHTGAIVGLVGMSRDITERKREEENRHRAQKLEALGTLAGGVAHDFNNILLAISGNATLAKEDLPAGHPAQLSLDEIKQAATRATDLIRRILAFTRGSEPHLEPTDFLSIAEEAFKLLRATLPASIKIELKSSGPLPTIAADATQIHQVLMNLTVNAAQAIGLRSGVIEIRLDTVVVTAEMVSMLPDLRQGRYLRLSLSDDGCGMDKETLERIFDPFFTTKAVGEGTGLGLSVVHGIMKRHAGAISVYSLAGKGTTFNLYFPTTEAEASAQRVRQTVRHQAAGERVLYVDDEDALVTLATRLLERAGYRVTAYTSPLEALQTFRSQPDEFDVVVTDLSMPGLSGFELAQSLLQTRSNIPIVMTSGYVRSEDQQRAEDMGIRALILKPNTVDELADVLDELFSGRRVPGS